LDVYHTSTHGESVKCAASGSLPHNWGMYRCTAISPSWRTSAH